MISESMILKVRVIHNTFQSFLSALKVYLLFFLPMPLLRLHPYYISGIKLLLFFLCHGRGSICAEQCAFPSGALCDTSVLQKLHFV